MLLATLLASEPAAAQNASAMRAAAQKAAVNRKLATLIEAAEFKYQKADDGVWVIAFDGQHTDTIDVVVQASGDMVVVLSTVKKKVDASTSLFRKFMQANYNANYAKLAIDTDGDLIALTELTADLSVDTLRKAVDEVASLTDTAVGLLIAAGTPLPSPAGSTSAAAAASETFDTVPAGSGATLPLLRGSFALSYDPAKWKPEATTEPNVTQLMHASGDAWLRVIAERLEIGPEALRDLAINNAQKAASELKLETETWRTINGLRTLVLRYAAAVQGINVTFYNQMYSDKDGLVQLAGWTTSNLIDEHRRDFLELFAGFSKRR